MYEVCMYVCIWSIWMYVDVCEVCEAQVSTFYNVHWLSQNKAGLHCAVAKEAVLNLNRKHNFDTSCFP